MDSESLVKLALYAPVVGGLSVLAWKNLTKPKTNLRGLPLPPGPKPLPLIGNLLDLPTGEVWKTYQEWDKLYGDIIYNNALGTHIIILNSLDAINDLMEKRGAIYSSRPRCVWVNELAGFEFGFSIAPYGDVWRTKRRAFHRYLNQATTPAHAPMQLHETRKYLRSLLSNPNGYREENHHLLGAIIMKVVYGHESAGANDPFLKTADEAIRNISEGLVPGRYLCDVIPALKYVPSWFPGAEFKRKAAHTARLLEDASDGPFGKVKAQIAAGCAPECMVTDILEKGESEVVAKDASALAYAVGADTTESSLATFFLAMVNHPEIQARAHAELDAVVGHDRLPDFGDRPHMPYLEAIVSEVLRWIPVTPLAIPHATTEDDEYRGYYIPKGSVIIGNTWGLLHDPEVYPDPEEFRPERFLTQEGGKWVYNTAVRDPRVAFFGFGRRICPGRHLSEQTMWAVYASTLATCRFLPPLDANGKPVYPKVEMTAGSALSFPAPFKCVIEPRSENVHEIITRALTEHH